MLFEIEKEIDGHISGMQTKEKSCIPFAMLPKMAAAGYRFKVDGKVVSAKNAEAAVNASLGITDSVSNKEPEIKPETKSTSKSVRCITTGETFPTQSAAARAYGIDPAQVSDSIKTGRPRSGYVFEKC